MLKKADEFKFDIEEKAQTVDEAVTFMKLMIMQLFLIT